jgi:hypothetical protein
MRVCEVGGAGEVFFNFSEKRKKEEKGRRELKELTVLPRLPRLPRKPPWLLGFKRGASAVKRINPRQKKFPICGNYQETSFNPYGGLNAWFNLFRTSVRTCGRFGCLVCALFTACSVLLAS